jgi:hypothetical protein
LANARPVRIPSNDDTRPSRPPQMREQPRPPRSIPAALVPGERRGAPRRSRASGGNGMYSSSTDSRAAPSRRQFPTAPIRSYPDRTTAAGTSPRERWVDERLYNGQ